MIKSVTVFLLFSLVILSACKDSKEQLKTAVISTKKAEREFIDFQTNFKAWWIYHHKNIALGIDFIPMDQNGIVIDKKKFFQLIKSGIYLIEKKQSETSAIRYQLVKMDHRVEKSVYMTLKSMGNQALHNLKLVGTPFPQFDFTDINGIEYNNASIKGKTIIVKCWLTGCAPCVKEIPELNVLVEKFKGRDELIFLSLAKDDDDALIKFLQKKPFSYEVVGNQSSFMSNELTFYEFPSHLVIDENGIIERVFTSVLGIENYLNKKFVSSKIEEELAPPPPVVL